MKYFEDMDFTKCDLSKPLAQKALIKVVDAAKDIDDEHASEELIQAFSELGDIWD